MSHLPNALLVAALSAALPVSAAEPTPASALEQCAQKIESARQRAAAIAPVFAGAHFNIEGAEVTLRLSPPYDEAVFMLSVRVEPLGPSQKDDGAWSLHAESLGDYHALFSRAPRAMMEFAGGFTSDQDQLLAPIFETAADACLTHATQKRQP